MNGLSLSDRNTLGALLDAAVDEKARQDALAAVQGGGTAGSGM